MLGPLFGDRMSALKDLVDLKKRPPAPRPSAPKATRASAPKLSALDQVAEQDVKLDGGALADIADVPTQAHVKLSAAALKPGPPVPDFDPHATNPRKVQLPDFDPHSTKPGRGAPDLAKPRMTDQQFPQTALPPARTSGPKAVGQAELEKARAKGQEKISTADLEPEDLSLELQSLQGDLDEGALGAGEDPPTNIKPRLTGERPAIGYEDPKKKVATMEVDSSEDEAGSAAPVETKKKSRGPKVVIAVLALLLIGGGAVATLRPDLLERLRGQGAAAPVPTAVEEVPLDDVVLLEDGGQAPAAAAVAGTDAGDDSADGGEGSEIAALGGLDAGPARDGGKAADAGLTDGGRPDAGSVDAGKPAPPVQKKKKKKRSR